MKNLMKKGLATLALVVFTTAPVFAETQETKEFRKNYGTVKSIVKPRGIDKTAVNLSKQFAAGKNTPQPTMGQNGAVVYQYGSTVTRVICRTLRITDIELEPGETVTSAPFIGDSVNWQILPSASGTGDNLCYHIMIKPSMPDLSTNLVVHTDRRSYHFELVSSKTEHTPLIKFAYPQMQTQQGGTTGWQEFIASRIVKRQTDENTYRVPHFNAETMDDNFIIKGKKSIKWFPKRVYTDNIKTYIEFENNLSNLEAPVFQIVRNGAREMVNYRQIGNIFIVDYLFDVGILIAGSGRQQQKVVIRRIGDQAPVVENASSIGTVSTITETDDEGRIVEQAKITQAIALIDKEKLLRERLTKFEARAEAQKLAIEKAKVDKENKTKLEFEKARIEKEKADKAIAEKQARLDAEQKKLEAEKEQLRLAEQKKQEEEKARAKAESERQAKIHDIQKKKTEILKRIEEIQRNRQK